MLKGSPYFHDISMLMLFRIVTRVKVKFHGSFLLKRIEGPWTTIALLKLLLPEENKISSWVKLRLQV